ncbi:MAG TPA: SLC13 family permease [Alphaproteobacteria bacterium]|nr:SLC13 family permease [Alphaproteobacteria bacterium]
MIELPPEVRHAAVTALFAATYVGMALGRVPGLAVDRTGIALLAATGVLLIGGLPTPRLLAAVDFPTLAILFGLMILSAQFVLAGFYDWTAARIAVAERSPQALLALTVIVGGALSALLANDIVVFAMTPVLCAGVVRRGLDPRPFLIALAGASNAGSAATVIGNPQNILIAQAGDLPFWEFLAICGPPAAFGLVAVYATVRLVWRRELAVAAAAPAIDPPPIGRQQTLKGAAAAALLVAAFAIGAPHGPAALAVAALLIVSRRFATRRMMAQVDWSLLVLFGALFLINAAYAETGLAARALDALAEGGLLPDQLSVMVPLMIGASNTIGNVPAVILLLSLWPAPPEGALYGLAVLSTLAGNLLLIGSVANLIVAERAASVGVRLGFAEHARCGVPMSLVSLAAAALWLWAGGWMAW